MWTALGRRIIGNLTTVSTSVNDFVTLLIGQWFAETIAQEQGTGSELATFLKWEQLAAYARAHVNRDFGFRGSDRVKMNLQPGKHVTVSDDAGSQILGNQKINGVWGLYTSPARASALLDSNPPRLTEDARRLVKNCYLPIFAQGNGPGFQAILKIIRQPSSRINLDGTGSKPLRAVARVFRRRMPEAERKFFETHLLFGGSSNPTNGCQKQLVALLRDTLDVSDFAWSPSAVGALAKCARMKGPEWEPLSRHLSDIKTSEAVFAPASAAFNYLLGFDRKTIDEVAKRLTKTWGTGLPTVDSDVFATMIRQVDHVDSEAGARWSGIAQALAQGAHAELIHHLVEQNRVVMMQRGGAPWIDIHNSGLHVRFRDESGAIPDRKDIPALWRFSYFLESLRSIAIQLRDA